MDNKKMTQKMGVIIMIVLGLTTISYYNDVPFVAVVNSVLNDFPSATGSQANFIVTGASLVFAFVCLITGFICSKIGSKITLLIGLALTIISGCGLAFAHSVSMMIILRTIMGVGAAFSNVAPYIIINSLFVSEKSRSTTVGIYDAFAGAMGFVLSFAAGIACMSSWKNLIYIYAVTIPVLILALVLIPSDKKLKSMAAAETEPSTEVAVEAPQKEEVMTWGQFVLYIIPFIIISMVALNTYYYVSVFFAEKGITNTAAAGTANALYLVSSLVGSSTFGFYYKKMKHKLNFITLVLALAATAMVYFSHNLIILVLALALTGIAYNVNFILHLTYYPLVAPSKGNTIVSILTFIMGFGPVVAGYIMVFLMSSRGYETYTQTLPFMMILMVVGIVIQLLTAKGVKNVDIYEEQ